MVNISVCAIKVTDAGSVVEVAAAFLYVAFAEAHELCEHLGDFLYIGVGVEAYCEAVGNQRSGIVDK